MTSFKRGDVVLVDLGMMAKVRPCVVVSIANPDSQRKMVVVVPMTTEVRKGEFEVTFTKPPWLRQPSVVNLLGIAGVDQTRIERQLAVFPIGPMEEISRGLVRLLGLKGFAT
jgi:mRNA interferase MazF